MQDFSGGYPLGKAFFYSEAIVDEVFAHIFLQVI